MKRGRPKGAKKRRSTDRPKGLTDHQIATLPAHAREAYLTGTASADQRKAAANIQPNMIR